MSKSDNIFWKMIRDQKKPTTANKPPPQETKAKQTFTKPIKKINSTILEKIEKVSLNTSTQSTFPKRASIKNKEFLELERLDKISTFNKIIKLQNLCKEMISAKERFSINKIHMTEKINKNCFTYYKNKVCMKEIYDFCKTRKPEEHIDYILIEEPEKFFIDKYNNIYNFLFMLRNNNKLMLKLINYCNEENYEQISDFIVNFFYEDTINSSFIQEELMLFIYLILEKYFFGKLPDDIKINDNQISYDIFRNKKNIIYYIVKSLTRKADIRNFLCSILVDDILKLEGNRKYLSPDIFSSKNLEEDDYEKDNNDEEESPTLFLKKYTISQKIGKKLKISYNAANLSRTATKQEDPNANISHNFDDNNNNIEELNNDKNEDINNDNISEENIFNPLELLENTSSDANLDKITLDPFFAKNNANSETITKLLNEYEHYSKTSYVNLAMIDYLNSLLKDINENKKHNKDKTEIYSNSKLIKVLKIIKIKEEEDLENKTKNNKSFDKAIEMIKNNYNLIEEIINDILEKLNENITSVPFTIKCISNIIEQLLNKKYIKKSKNTLSHYQNYIFKSNFFIGNILLSCIKNRDYNGIITSDVTSKMTTENLKIIYDIFDKLLSGKLFQNDSNDYFFYTLFNKYIVKTMPKIFNIIDKIEKKFKLPDIMQKLINTVTEKNNTKRLNDFEYDYFFEKNEDIQYQSLCFNLDNLGLLCHLLNELKNKENYFNSISDEKDKKLLETISGYEKEFKKIFLNNKNNNHKCEYFIINKLVFSSKTEGKINLILKDNLTDNGNINISDYHQNKNRFLIFKKCLIEVLGYVNIIDKSSFLTFTLNKKELLHNYQDKKNVYKKLREKEYNKIVFEKDIKRDNYIDDINFKDVLFQRIMDYLKYEIGFNTEDPKSQRIIFCTSYIQSHMEDISKEYSDNNCSKLFLDLIKETMTILGYLNSNILNQLYNKIKEGNKLNMIIASNCLQIKSLEKFKCIEFLYSKLLIPNKFKITKDENDNITKVEYIRDKPAKKVDPPPPKEPKPTANNEDKTNENEKKENKEHNDKKEIKEKKETKEKKEVKDKKETKEIKDKKDNKENKDNLETKDNTEKQKENINTNHNEHNNNEINDNININNEINNQPKPAPTPPPPKLELIRKLIDIIPNYRDYEKNNEDIIKMEENTGIGDALKNFFRTMKILVKKEKVVKRFSKDEIDSIVIDLENYILFKLYDKLYPTKSCKDDIRFYKKCCRLNFIKPNNIITDKNIVNEKLWKTSMEYFNEINSKYTPADKIKSISKAFAILQNSITFCSGKKELGVDDTIKPLIYVMIKTKPTNLFNNYNYCQLFLNSDLAKKEYGILLTQIYLIMKIIKDMKYSDLIGVTEQEFGKDEDV